MQQDKAVIIARDTRDQIGKHDNVDLTLSSLGFKIVRTKLYVGDVTLLNDQTTCIDLKQDMQEVYNNIIGAQHQRFRAECERAKESGIRLIILVEQGGIESVQDVAKWVNPRIERWNKIHNGKLNGGYRNINISKKPPVSSAQLSKSMQTMSEKYGVEWRFCQKWQTVHVICEVLGIE